MLLCVTALNIYWLALRSCPVLPGCVWKQIDFFSVLAFRPQAHWNSIFSDTKNAGFREQSQVEFLFKNASVSFSCGREKTKVSFQTMMSYVIQRMPCKGFYPTISPSINPTIVLAFPCGRARMICIHYVWMCFFFGKNSSVFEISGYQCTGF